MRKKKRSYSDELKSEAVKMVNEQGLSQEEAGRRLSIPKGTIANWVAASKSAGDLARPGDPSVAELAATETIIDRDRISRLRREMGLTCVQQRKFKATTDSAHSLPVAPNLLNQEFTVVEPGTVYGSDMTYIPTDEGWLYLAGVKDLANREIIGHAMGSRMTKKLTGTALAKAIDYRQPRPGCIHHSDRGSQYCALSYQRAVTDAGMRPSMSRKGNGYDNAPVESFWGLLKQELVHQRRFATRAEARAAIQEYIEVFYNRMRRHSALGNIAPAIFAENYFSQRRTA